MRIRRINDNKLEVFICAKDLEGNDITIQDFMSSSFHRRSFMFDILKFANKEINFNYRNCKVILESFSIPAIKSFILTITRMPYKLNKNSFQKLRMNTYLLVKFKDFNTLSAFCNSLNRNIISNLYFYNCFYYLNLKITRISDFNKVFFHLKEFTKDYKFNFFMTENADLLVKNNAVEICKEL